MKILVPTKRVEHYESKIRLKADRSGIVTDGLTYIINPFDEIAVEEAIRLKDTHEAEVIVVSIGGEEATQQLRSALALGADRAILVKTNETLDSWGIAKTLQALVEREEPTLVLMGKQAIDDDANQTGQILAELLGWPQATFASKKESLESSAEKNKEAALQIEDETLTVVREVDGGLETLAMTLPAVVSVDLRLNVPRYATLPNIMKAKKKPLEEVSLGDLGCEEMALKVRVLGYEPLPERKAGVKVGSVTELLDKLQFEAKVL